MRSVVDRVKEAGMSYLGLSVPGPGLYRGPAYPDEGQLADAADWNWEPYDELMDYAARQGVSVVPTLNLSDPPSWWAADHPDDVQTDSEGTSWNRASFASDSHRRWIGELLAVFVNRYKDHPALLGWDVRVGEGENNYPPPYTVDIFDPPDTWCDYSPGTLERFRAWLRTEYGGDVAALRAAWNEPAVTFGTASGEPVGGGRARQASRLTSRGG